MYPFTTPLAGPTGPRSSFTSRPLPTLAWRERRCTSLDAKPAGHGGTAVHFYNVVDWAEVARRFQAARG